MAAVAMLCWRRPAAELLRVRRAARRAGPSPSPLPPSAAPAPPPGPEGLGQGHTRVCGGEGCPPPLPPAALRGGRQAPARQGAEGRERVLGRGERGPARPAGPLRSRLAGEGRLPGPGGRVAGTALSPAGPLAAILRAAFSTASSPPVSAGGAAGWPGPSLAASSARSLVTRCPTESLYPSVTRFSHKDA